MTTAARRKIMVTDLDQSDTQIGGHEEHHKFHKKRTKDNILHTFSANFNRRSRSAETVKKDDKICKSATKHTGYIHEVLQSKDQQMEKLLRRLATLHKFNEQFAEENKRLLNDIKCMEQRIAALQHQIADCDNCYRLDNELTKRINENNMLTGDVEMMKTLVYRLNVQIERYQDYLRSKTTTDETQIPNQNPNINLNSSIGQWQQGSLRTHTLSPLLQAYDEMLRDKEDLIQQYTQEFEHFTGKLKSVIEENNRLQQVVENLKRDGGNWREEKTRLQAQLDICREKADSQTRKTDLAKEKLIEVMHCYEQKLQTLVLELDHLQSAYARCKAELASLKSVTSLPQATITTSLQECKELLEQLREQHIKEKHSLERTIAELNERNSNVYLKIENLKHENIKLKLELQEHTAQANDLGKSNAALKHCVEKVKRSRDRLKARLRIALQWAKKLEEGQANLQGTWDALKRLETIVKHKESQVRGLHARHLEEIDKLEKVLAQKDETIKNILRDRINGNTKR